MLIPIVIFIFCLSTGVVASARWLPDFAEGMVGGLAFFGVCGLLGTALALVGLRIYLIVEGIEHYAVSLTGIGRADIITTGLANMLWEAGSLLGFAMIVYLLAPGAPEMADESVTRSSA
jgi:hypothetical protein